MSATVRRPASISEPPSVTAAAAVPTRAVWWTVERGLYAAALLLGLGLRLFQLGHVPLSAWEAGNVWPAWLAAQGQIVPDAPLPNSPLMYNLHWLLFMLGAQTDAATRIFSAVAGAGLALTPWALRGWLGRRAAVIAAFVLAVDPWLLLFGRMADGAGLALLLGMAAVAGVVHLAETERPSRSAATLVAACAGLLVVSGPLGWNLLPILLLALWLFRRDLTARGYDLAALGSAAGLAAAAGGTLMLVRMDALAWLSSGLSVWLSQFDGSPAGPLHPLAPAYDLGWPWLRLLVDAPLAGFLGVAGLTLLWLEGADRRVRLLGLWLAWGIVLWLAPGRGPLALPAAGLALDLLAAAAIARLMQRPADAAWHEAAAVWLTLIIMLVSGWIQAATFGSLAVLDARLGQTLLVVGVLIAAILVAYGVWAGRLAVVWITVVALTAGLALLTIRSSAALVQEQTAQLPYGWQVIQTDPEVRRLAADVQTLSAHRLGDATEAPVQVQVAAVPSLTGEPVAARPDPVLGWYLRQMRRLSWVATPRVQTEGPQPLVIMVNGESFTGDEQRPYIGSAYDVELYWPQTTLAANRPAQTDDLSTAERLWPELRAWWRWWLYGEVAIRPATRTVTLWAPVGAVVTE